MLFFIRGIWLTGVEHLHRSRSWFLSYWHVSWLIVCGLQCVIKISCKCIVITQYKLAQYCPLYEWCREWRTRMSVSHLQMSRQTFLCAVVLDGVHYVFVLLVWCGKQTARPDSISSWWNLLIVAPGNKTSTDSRLPDALSYERDTLFAKSVFWHLKLFILSL